MTDSSPPKITALMRQAMLQMAACEAIGTTSQTFSVTARSRIDTNESGPRDIRVGKNKHGGRKNHTNRDKAKAARKARKKNRR